MQSAVSPHCRGAVETFERVHGPPEDGELQSHWHCCGSQWIRAALSKTILFPCAFGWAVGDKTGEWALGNSRAVGVATAGKRRFPHNLARGEIISICTRSKWVPHNPRCPPCNT
eukprot:EG_transcript_24570